jgi:glucokinase
MDPLLQGDDDFLQRRLKIEHILEVKFSGKREIMKDRNAFLVGDIGGTKTTLAVIEPAAGLRSPLAEETYPSAGYASLESLVSDFCFSHSVRVEHACFGVAGPVIGSEARITNLPWVIREEVLEDVLGLRRAKLLNDLEAVAWSLPLLGAGDLDVLNVGEPQPHGPVAIVAPGTGLGEAYLTWDGSLHRAWSSEGGHADFAPNDEFEGLLLDYLRDRFGHVSVERVCSGRGIRNIYEFLRDEGHAPVPGWLSKRLADVEDLTPVIVEAALTPHRVCEICTRTVEMFLGILGAESGNVALRVFALGGVYLGGGIPPRLLPALRSGTFMRSFTAKGRMSPFLKSVPVSVISNPKAALWGAGRWMTQSGLMS